ncbi:MAG: hypothetical protein ACD_73C00688G0002 [uncultured bacterium]|nr:MAG: hypothetical protein ACD_73C00688G0002 [uncultured bacterium]
MHQQHIDTARYKAYVEVAEVRKRFFSQKALKGALIERKNMMIAITFWLSFWSIVLLGIALGGLVQAKGNEKHSLKAHFIPRHRTA